jgi:hypothetical protein
MIISNVTFTDEELTRIRRAYNIEEKNTGFQIKTNEEMRNEIIIEAYVSGIDALSSSFVNFNFISVTTTL